MLRPCKIYRVLKHISDQINGIFAIMFLPPLRIIKPADGMQHPALIQDLAYQDTFSREQVKCPLTPLFPKSRHHYFCGNKPILALVTKITSMTFLTSGVVEKASELYPHMVACGAAAWPPCSQFIHSL